MVLWYIVVIWFFPPCFVLLLLLPFMMLRSYPHIIARVVWSTSSQLSACPQPKPERTMMIFMPYYIPFASTADTVFENYPKCHICIVLFKPRFTLLVSLPVQMHNDLFKVVKWYFLCDFQKSVVAADAEPHTEYVSVVVHQTTDYIEIIQMMNILKILCISLPLLLLLRLLPSPFFSGFSWWSRCSPEVCVGITQMRQKSISRFLTLRITLSI